MELIDVVERLVGPVDPVGDSNIDRDRFENLKKFTELTGKMIQVIDEIETRNADSYEGSRKIAGTHCSKFLDGLAIKE